MQRYTRVTHHSYIVMLGVIISLFLPIVTACANGADGSESMPTASTNNTAPAAARAAESSSVGTAIPDQIGEPVPDPVLAAIDRAIQEFEVRRDKIQVTSFTETQWLSTALGCPDPDRSYAQIINPGFVVDLKIAGKMITYHTDSASTVIHCSNE